MSDHNDEPKTLYAASVELSEAVRQLLLQAAYALRINALCEWLTKAMKRFTN